MSMTSVIRYVRALDSTATDGSGKTGLAFGDITAKYLTQGGTLTSLTTETITTLGTYQAPTSAAHIRIKELNNTDPTKGVYEVHFHNTQVVDTGKKLWLFLSASGAAFQPLEMELIVPSYLDAAITSRASQTSVDDLPTNAELATSQAAADDATLAAIAALNNISIAQVNAEVDQALADVGLTTTITGRIDAAITSRMATYVQPTGFLAATFPSDPADASDIAASFSTVNSTLSTIAGYIDTEVAAIKAKTDLIPASPAAVGSAMTLTSGERTAIAAAAFVTQMTEAYAADGTEPTLAQMLYMTYSAVAQFSISGTALTTKKLDGTTQAMVFTLDDATTPTSRVRSS